MPALAKATSPATPTYLTLVARVAVPSPTWLATSECSSHAVGSKQNKTQALGICSAFPAYMCLVQKFEMDEHA
jgi:hypothetical protein